MDKEEIIFNPETPLAHYEKCRNIYLDYRSSVSFATVMAVAAFIVGFICVMSSSAAMAIFFFTATPFTLMSIIGCQARRPKMCIFAIPLGLVAGISAVVTGSSMSVVGLIGYAIAAFAVFRAAQAIADFSELQNLPGFPLFDAAYDDATFAIMDALGSEEFIDESIIHEEVRGERFIAPSAPSDEMDEIFTVGTVVSEDRQQLTAYELETAREVSDVPEDLRDEVAMSLGHLAPNLAEYEKAAAEERAENSDRAYEKMIMLQQGKGTQELSDVDLFG